MGWTDGAPISVDPVIDHEALPCPFCGELPKIQPWHGGSPTKVLISCDNEDCEVGPSVTGGTADEAHERWNWRYSA